MRQYVNFTEMINEIGIENLANTKVLVDSYGYTEKGMLSQHFEPFKHKRTFEFEFDVFGEMVYLNHSWLTFDNEYDEQFYFEDGHWRCDDPELLCFPKYD